MAFFNTHRADLLNTDVSFVTNNDDDEAYAIDAIVLKAGKTYSNGFIDALVDIDGITIEGDSSVTTDNSTGNVTVSGDNVTLKYFTIAGDLAVAGDDFTSVENHITGDVTVTGDNASFNTEIDGNVVVNGEGASFANVTVGGNFTVGATGSAKVSGTTSVTGTITVDPAAEFDASDATDTKVVTAGEDHAEAAQLAAEQEAVDEAKDALDNATAAQKQVVTDTDAVTVAEGIVNDASVTITTEDTDLTDGKITGTIGDTVTVTFNINKGDATEKTSDVTFTIVADEVAQAVLDAGNQVELLAALENEAFDNVNADYIAEYDTELDGSQKTVETIQGAIDDVNEAQTALDSFDAVTLTQTGTIDGDDVQYADADAVIAALPTEIEVTLVDGSKVDVPVTWVDTDTYDAGTAGDYTFTATWGEVPEGANNSASLAAPTVDVTVAQN